MSNRCGLSSAQETACAAAQRSLLAGTCSKHSMSIVSDRYAPRSTRVDEDIRHAPCDANGFSKRLQLHNQQPAGLRNNIFRCLLWLYTCWGFATLPYFEHLHRFFSTCTFVSVRYHQTSTTVNTHSSQKESLVGSVIAVITHSHWYLGQVVAVVFIRVVVMLPVQLIVPLEVTHEHPCLQRTTAS